MFLLIFLPGGRFLRIFLSPVWSAVVLIVAIIPLIVFVTMSHSAIRSLKLGLKSLVGRQQKRDLSGMSTQANSQMTLVFSRKGKFLQFQRSASDTNILLFLILHIMALMEDSHQGQTFIKL
ncbi:unnamed protein product [Protopolystoma xenopodis]|uniref:Uncharacterized protein n=1 Tax=Protopolystoma xenopodis TaxID=117903 RepID=A0A448WZ08_9PLAT|nr:unnamed protein product [Protopolystoma xenopodis]